MPQFRKIMMDLTNNNYVSMRRIAKQQKIANASNTSLRIGGLQNAMIERIHNIRPGCGSCGK